MKVFKASYLINPLPTPLPRGPLRLSTQNHTAYIQIKRIKDQYMSTISYLLPRYRSVISLQ